MDTEQVWRRGDAYPADWPEWLRSADIEWCRVEIAEGGKVVWHDGIWRNGNWRGGEWRDGAWFDGVWYGGDWRDGIWRNGIWHSGEWYGGRWLDGGWYDGGWHDGERHNGVWHDGIWHDGVWYGGRWRYGVWHDGVWLDDGEWRTDGPPDDSIQPEKHMSNTEPDVIEYPHHDMDLRDRLAAHAELHDEAKARAERLAEALEDLITWIPSADTYRRLGFDPEAPMRALERARTALAKENSND